VPQQEIQKTGLSVQTPSSSNDDMTVATVVQHVMTELSEAVSDEDKIMIITKMVLNETELLLEFICHSKVIVFNANGIWIQCNELSRQL
jgi:hypothetical protein